MLRTVIRVISLSSLLLLLAAVLYGSYRLLRDADFSLPTLFRPAPGKRLLMSMEGYRFSRSLDGGVPWRITASRAELFESREARLQDIEVLFRGEDGRTVVLLGETGSMDTAGGNATIRRGAREVRVVTSDGYLMTTNTLFWKANERVVRTPEPFKVLGREIYLEGRGFSADVDMRKILVNSNVKAVLQE